MTPLEFSPSLGIQVEEMIIMKYHDRGDPVAPDFTTPDFTADGAWHTLDLSAIVPEEAADHLVLLRFKGKIAMDSGDIHIRKPGRVGVQNCFLNEYEGTEPTNKIASFWVIVDASRHIEYQISAGDWALFELVVRGWVTD